MGFIVLVFIPQPVGNVARVNWLVILGALLHHRTVADGLHTHLNFMYNCTNKSLSF